MLRLTSLLVLLGASSGQVLTKTCPATIQKGQPFNVTQATTTIVIDKTVRAGSLCTLTLELEDGSFIPIARSYDGNDWERAGGSFIAGSPEWLCSGSTCSTTIPIGNQYVLQTRSISAPVLHADAVLARFLEAASFGAKPTDLATWNGISFAQYIKDQVNVPATSHRELFRRLANPRWIFNKPEFPGHLNPCASNATWRRQVFTSIDDDKVLKVSKIGAMWEIKVDGFVRTMVPQLRFVDGKIPSVSHGGSYQLCSDTEEFRRNIFKVTINGKCRQLVTEDLMVGFPSTFRPVNSVKELIPSFADKSTWQATSSRNPEYILKGRITPSCTIQNPSTSVNAPLFAKTVDGIWLLYDPRVDMEPNTINQPLPDGGLGFLTAKKTWYCMNAARTVFNENQCIMSNVPACVPGSRNARNAKSGTIVCGSNGEVGNDLSLGDNWLDVYSFPADRAAKAGVPKETTPSDIVGQQREFLWSHIALHAKDQLRQRIAFALLHIFSLPKQSIENEHTLTEVFLIYYDIFVRNAFGNYGDILREISYNALNAESLTYVDSRSVAHAFITTKSVVFPDENYARELMQLFTIGLVQLNMDGTPVVDVNGTIPTYSSDDILSFAKVWTGFNRNVKRANVETFNEQNKFDPMRLDASKRDRFPKTNLAKGYIGDYYPLCTDLPAKAYLSVGSKFILLGSSSNPEVKQRTATQITQTLTVSNGSSLYNKLCKPSQSGQCSYPSVVILDSNLACVGLECSVDATQVVRVGSVFYEYVRVPCVEHPFVTSAIKVSRNSTFDLSFCVDPLLPVASAACCIKGVLESSEKVATPACLIPGEVMTRNNAQTRCASIGRELCTYQIVNATQQCPLSEFYWTTESCNTQVKVSSDGQAALVHKFSSVSGIPDDLNDNTPNFFKLHWNGGQYPSALNNCGNGQCRVYGDACICNITVSNDPVFVNQLPTNVDSILQQLFIGHPGRATLDQNSFVSYSAYNLYGKTELPLDVTTVFEVTDRNGQTRFLRNLKSTVNIAGTSFAFRNPPLFNSILPTEYSIADAHYETEAALDHLLYHSNTPPFLAYRFIQRFGVSNPTPRYTFAVANAFSSGLYVHQGITLGKGKYGDLEATIAAVLLDREARSLVLDKDPAHGSLREPILKVISFMRATNFTSTVPLVELNSMELKIGQMAYEQDSVFSFFRPEYSPSELVGTGLTAPESQTMSSSSIVGLLNGFYSLIKYGLNKCYGGFGQFGDCSNPITSGIIPYSPSSTIVPSNMVRDLSYLLTGGRMTETRQQIIATEVSAQPNATTQYRLALQLLSSSPEFHSTNSIDPLAPPERPPKKPSKVVPPTQDYKAVIHFMLVGGCDSFNVLVPASTCGNFHTEYVKARGAVGLPPAKTIPLSGGASQQPCSSFTVHNGLSVIQQMYNAQDLLFVANAGVLSQYVNRSNYAFRTETSLFSHNSMQDEVARLDPLGINGGTAALGRMTDVLQEKGYRTARATIDATSSLLASKSATTPPVFSMSGKGLNLFNTAPSSSTMNKTVERLNNDTTGMYGHLWSKLLKQSITQNDDMFSVLGTETTTVFPLTSLGRRFEIVAQTIAARGARGVDRDVFYIPMTGFDTHNKVEFKLDTLFLEMNDALAALVKELKLLGVWDNVAIVQTSDFGRTMSQNSGGGTDHGWGGNYWLAGGAVKGQRIIGKYPPTFSLDYEYNIDRGRIIPTTSWDSIFNALSEWMGVTDVKDLQRVLPNRDKFPDIFGRGNIFN